ncbi:periplasmic nitrate reductase, NapE protein [Noviherbaspirillum aridicola]|uniref:Nitrate reductase NapE n=1 Tax=Noviherbaspirillum aridicola TaxID=2849687 RepID=A0ABQ4PZQ0_9BURK|nr:periplasmic nitrate reductase, NapE protein [Noviherbaspirillum aridicola]GIZ50370.1 nitrate reductase NapE [Noviherbaspirillum aridicola]
MASENDQQANTRARELRAFFFLTLVMAPILAVMVVGGYGFFVWMFQLLTGRLPAAA